MLEGRHDLFGPNTGDESALANGAGLIHDNTVLRHIRFRPPRRTFERDTFSDAPSGYGLGASVKLGDLGGRSLASTV